MSFWFYKKDKKTLFAVDIPLELLMLVVALIAALLIPQFSKMRTTAQPIPAASSLNLPIFLTIAGFCLFLISKISLFTKGIWNSWGMSRMSGIFRVFYIMGYFLMAAGIALFLFQTT